MSAVVGLRREEREEGVVLPPREGVGVRDGRLPSDRELAEGAELLMPCPIALERQQAWIQRLFHFGLIAMATTGLAPPTASRALFHLNSSSNYCALSFIRGGSAAGGRGKRSHSFSAGPYD